MPAEPATPLIFGDVFDVLERADVLYVVVSGVAVVLHGHVRPVFDLDLVISPVPEQANRALHVLLLAGFVSTIPLPPSLVTVMRMFNQAGREVDVFMRYHISFAELWSSSVRIPVGASLARVASLEHLLRAKRITGRPHDLMDVDGLLALSTGQ